jgi:precorrin-3B C17-methyltransferase
MESAPVGSKSLRPIVFAAHHQMRSQVGQLLDAYPSWGLDWLGQVLASSDDSDDVYKDYLAVRIRACFASGHPCIVMGATIETVVTALVPIITVHQAPQSAPPVFVLAPQQQRAVAVWGTLHPQMPLLQTHLKRALNTLFAFKHGAPQSLALSHHHVTSVTQPAQGRLAVVGLGPGTIDWLTPAAHRELQQAQDIVGYTTYVQLAGPWRHDQVVHASDNRQELDRARLALQLAATGRQVAVISSGDPGIFAMASAVMEALEHNHDPACRRVQIVIVPGISAAQAAASLVGAPLGHDFCVLSLSDNLKPWCEIERRIKLAAEADLVMAFYNPGSRSRPWQFTQILKLLHHYRASDTPVVLGRDIGRPNTMIQTVTLAEVRPEWIDMRTVIIVGSSQTRRFPRYGQSDIDWVYTPRWYPHADDDIQQPSS